MLEPPLEVVAVTGLTTGADEATGTCVPVVLAVVLWGEGGLGVAVELWKVKVVVFCVPGEGFVMGMYSASVAVGTSYTVAFWNSTCNVTCSFTSCSPKAIREA